MAVEEKKVRAINLHFKCSFCGETYVAATIQDYDATSAAQVMLGVYMPAGGAARPNRERQHDCKGDGSQVGVGTFVGTSVA